jgi:hypothetical protein
MKTLLITSALLLLTTFAWSEENFVLVKLPRSIAVELPKNWIVHSRSDRITIDAAAQSIAEKAKMFDASSELSFAAGYIFAGRSACLFNIRYYPNLELTQKDARQFDKESISVLDGLIKENIVKAGELSSYTVPVWKGTTQKELNGMSAFITEYHRRSKENDGDFVVRLVRVFDEKSSFTITISYRESLEGVLRQICDHIIQSIAKA